MDIDGLAVGDRVGVKDSPDFPHWSNEGAVAAIPASGAGPMNSVEVRLDSGTIVPVLCDVLVRIGGPGAAESGWAAQAWPTNGDAPGPIMYFASGRDLLAFVRQFQDQKLDETIRVRVPAGADAGPLKAAGAVEM